MVWKEGKMTEIECLAIIPPHKGRPPKWPVRKLNKPGMCFFVAGRSAKNGGHVLSNYYNKKAKWPRGVRPPTFRAVDGEKEIKGKVVKGFWFQRII